MALLRRLCALSRNGSAPSTKNGGAPCRDAVAESAPPPVVVRKVATLSSRSRLTPAGGGRRRSPSSATAPNLGPTGCARDSAGSCRRGPREAPVASQRRQRSIQALQRIASAIGQGREDGSSILCAAQQGATIGASIQRVHAAGPAQGMTCAPLSRCERSAMYRWLRAGSRGIPCRSATPAEPVSHWPVAGRGP